MVSNVLEITGLAALTVGCLLIALPLGLIVGGAALVALGLALDPRKPTGGKP